MSSEECLYDDNGQQKKDEGGCDAYNCCLSTPRFELEVKCFVHAEFDDGCDLGQEQQEPTGDDLVLKLDHTGGDLKWQKTL